MTQPFEVGDEVTCVSGWGSTYPGELYKVAAVYKSSGMWFIKVKEHLKTRPNHSYDAARFRRVPASPDVADRRMILSEDAQVRKNTPITTGVLDYFPRALVAVAQCSKAGNDQHNPGQPLHWAKGKSTDHADCISRHLIDRHTVDTDGIKHAAKLAWRALALLETILEEEEKK